MDSIPSADDAFALYREGQCKLVLDDTSSIIRIIGSQMRGRMDLKIWKNFVSLDTGEEMFFKAGNNAVSMLNDRHPESDKKYYCSRMNYRNQMGFSGILIYIE